MFKKNLLKSYITHGFIAAVMFCIPMIFFLRSGDFGDIYLLYVGNALFLIGIVFFLLQYNKKRAENASTSSMLMAGHITTAAGVIIACVLTLLLAFIFIPDIFQSNVDGTVLENANPSQPAAGRHKGILLVLFMNTIIGNVCTGSFVSLLLPYTIKRDQTKDKASEFLNIRKVKNTNV